jgi:hypothetical protein
VNLCNIHGWRHLMQPCPSCVSFRAGQDAAALAFPHHETWDAEKTDIGWIGGGLTKRELFAAMAMQGILASPWASRHRITSPKDLEFEGRTLESLAVNFADGLLEELEK